MPLRSLLERFSGFSVSNRPLAPLTAWGIGGIARVFITPRSEAELAEAVSGANRACGHFYVLGGGSNLLINDGTIEAPILYSGGLDAINVTVRSDRILLECGAGVDLKKIFALAIRKGWSGLEFLAGIPGTVGGAVMGNAGTRLGAIAESVVRVRTIEADGTTRDWSGDDLEWGYRRSSFSRGTSVIVRVLFSLRASERASVLERVKTTLEARKSQPFGAKTAGCVFKNPPGDVAGRLLDQAGCKGLMVGGAVVSDRHANFFENKGGATAKDVAELVRVCGEHVYDAFGVELELEIKTMGFEEPFPLR